jgi:hypothetical protein
MASLTRSAASSSSSAGALVRVAASSLAKDEKKKKKKVSPRKLLMQRKAELVEAEASASLLFHCSGVNCKQWRELKNSLASVQGKSLFQPNFKQSGIKGNSDRSTGTAFASKIASSPGPLCLLYLGKGASPDMIAKLLPPPSLSDSMLLLYGQQKDSILNHVDVKKASTLDLQSVYRRSVFSTLFNPMAFFSGLDRIRAAKEAMENPASTVPSAASTDPATA